MAQNTPKDKILATISFVGKDSSQPANVLVFIVSWFASGDYLITTGFAQSGQSMFSIDVDQSEAQIVNEIKQNLIDLINPNLDADFAISDVRGCNI